MPLNKSFKYNGLSCIDRSNLIKVFHACKNPVWAGIVALLRGVMEAPGSFQLVVPIPTEPWSPLLGNLNMVRKCDREGIEDYMGSSNGQGLGMLVITPTAFLCLSPVTWVHNSKGSWKLPCVEDLVNNWSVAHINIRTFLRSNTHDRLMRTLINRQRIELWRFFLFWITILISFYRSQYCHLLVRRT